MAKTKAKSAKKPMKKSPAKKAVTAKKTAPKPKKTVKAAPKKPDALHGAVKNTKSTRITKLMPKDSKKNVPPMKLTANDGDVIANAKVRYGAKDLDMFRKVILEQRDEAKEEFDIISQQLLDTSGEYDGENQSFALHTAEQGSDAMEREKQYLQAQRTSDYIKKLDEALERIQRGTYGICVICGNLIEKQRLYAVPITQKHVACKNKTNVKKVSSASEGTYAPEVEDVVE